MLCSSLLARAILAAAMTAVSVAYANAQQFQAIFSGYNVVPPVNSTAQATLKMTLNTQLQSLTYTLTYSGLSSSILGSAILFARARDNGGIIALLCSVEDGAAFPGTPACSGVSGTITGTITPASVQAIPGNPNSNPPMPPQGITAGDFGALARALVSQSTYVVVADGGFPNGEIRGEIIQCPGSGCP
jgi:hypothetical protein